MSRSGGTYRIGTGATSLLMILVILCLTALSVVSYTSAHSELSITRRAAKVQEAVYAATAEGYDRLAGAGRGRYMRWMRRRKPIHRQRQSLAGRRRRTAGSSCFQSQKSWS